MNNRDVSGITHCTSSASVTFTKGLTQTELEAHVKTALIRMRHQVPAIAVTTHKLPSHQYEMLYRVPGSLKEAEEWATEVLFFYTGVGSHDEVARSTWWKSRDGKYTHQLHVAPATEQSMLLTYRSWKFSWVSWTKDIDCMLTRTISGCL